MNIEMIADYACGCGEGPLWHAQEKRIYWTDIAGAKLFRYEPATGTHEQIYHQPDNTVGGFTIQADGSLLLFRTRGNIVVWRDGKVLRTIAESIPGEEKHRFNDVIADPQGRVYCGTMGPTPGRLYRLDIDGTLTAMFGEVGCSNGMGFTPDRKHMYFTDTRTHRIDLFDYDAPTGNLTNRRKFVDVVQKDGGPDGMTVDAAGNVYTAVWAGSCVLVFSPQGRQIDRIEVPALKASSVIFGGNDLRDLYITTAAGDHKDTDGPQAGALFRVRAAAQGVAEFVSRVSL